jgi:hypothetical protein
MLYSQIPGYHMYTYDQISSPTHIMNDEPRVGRNSNQYLYISTQHSSQPWRKDTLAAMRYGDYPGPCMHFTNFKQFFTKLTKMIEGKQQKGHGSVFLTQKRRTYSRTIPTETEI